MWVYDCWTHLFHIIQIPFNNFRRYQKHRSFTAAVSEHLLGYDLLATNPVPARELNDTIICGIG